MYESKEKLRDKKLADSKLEREEQLKYKLEAKNTAYSQKIEKYKMKEKEFEKKSQNESNKLCNDANAYFKMRNKVI